LAVLEIGGIPADVPAGRYILRYEPGHAIVTTDAGERTLRADGYLRLELLPGRAKMSIRLVPGGVRLVPVDQ